LFFVEFGTAEYHHGESIGVCPFVLNAYDKIPDVRHGLTREERVVLRVLHETQKERGDRNVPTAMLWGRHQGPGLI
jgi:hypothetical protein